jgi:hypothetical protein
MINTQVMEYITTLNVTDLPNTIIKATFLNDNLLVLESKIDYSVFDIITNTNLFTRRSDIKFSPIQQFTNEDVAKRNGLRMWGSNMYHNTHCHYDTYSILQNTYDINKIIHLVAQNNSEISTSIKEYPTFAISSKSLPEIYYWIYNNNVIILEISTAKSTIIKFNIITSVVDIIDIDTLINNTWEDVYCYKNHIIICDKIKPASPPPKNLNNYCYIINIDSLTVEKELPGVFNKYLSECMNNNMICIINNNSGKTDILIYNIVTTQIINTLFNFVPIVINDKCIIGYESLPNGVKTDKIYTFKNKIVDEDQRCVICFEYMITRNKALVPCGHTQYCGECITKITQCSLCNVVISQIITLF